MDDRFVYMGLDLASGPDVSVVMINGHVIKYSDIRKLALAYGIGEEEVENALTLALRPRDDVLTGFELDTVRINRRPEFGSIPDIPEFIADLPLKKARNLRDATPWTHGRNAWETHRPRKPKGGSKRGKR